VRDEHRRHQTAFSSPTEAHLSVRESERLKDEIRVKQNQFNLLFGFVAGVFVGVVWEVLRRR